jgi:hypothetical protein
MPLWLWLWLAVPVLGGLLAWMILSGWWLGGNQRCWDKMKEK